MYYIINVAVKTNYGFIHLFKTDKIYYVNQAKDVYDLFKKTFKEEQYDIKITRWDCRGEDITDKF